jgi:uncharacterized protein YjaG (DUF416 family)
MMSQDYLHDLVKEEEEQRKIQKVTLLVSLCETMYFVFFKLCSYSVVDENRKNKERQSVKIVTSSASCLKNMLLQELLQPKLSGVIIT